MPRERLDIRLFNKGMIPNADQSDIDFQAASWCRNVDLGTREGQLIGVPGNEDKSTSIGAVGDAQGYGWVEKTDGKRTLIYFDRDTGYVKHLEDFHGTPGSPTNVVAFSANYVNFIRRHQTLRYGGFNSSGNPNTTPRWIGYTSNSIFGSTSSSLVDVVQECVMYDGSTSNGYLAITDVVAGTIDANGFFTAGKKYYYRFAIEYDGYQVSVLDADAYAANVNYFDTSASVYSDLSITVRAYGGATSPSSFNKRITGILVFRADGASSGSAPSTLYRFAKRIAIDDAGWATAAVNHKDITFIDSGTEGDTFATYTGLAETATNSIMGWGIGCAADNYMFIGNCDSTLIDDAQYMIFRSVAGRYDVYDFESANPSFIKLPIRPSAMCFFFGRLLVFDGNHMIRINPDTLSIEDIVDGYGCLHPQSLCVTRVGVFFADKNGINLYDGKNVSRITQAIYEFPVTLQHNTGALVSITDDSYKTMASTVTSTNNFKLEYHSLFDMLLVGISSGSPTSTVIYGYSVKHGSWTLLQAPDSSAAPYFSFIVDKDSYVYIASRYGSANKLHKFMSDFANRKTFEWITNRITFTGGSDDIYQKFYKVHTSDSGSVTRYYGINEGVISTSLSTDDIAAGDRRAKSIRLYLASSSSNKYINSVSVIYRRMIGER